MGQSHSLSIEEMMVPMMPLYYSKECVKVEDIERCSSLWDGILHDTIPNYRLLAAQPGFKYNNCRVWFYHSFYDRLRDLYPYTRDLFINGIDTVGVFMVKMFSMCFLQLQNQSEFEKTLKELAIRHCERGIQANEFILFGEVLFYSIKQVAGDLYSPELDKSWKLLYSSMLTVIIPECLRFGLSLQQRGGDYANLRERAKHAVSYSCAPEGSVLAINPPAQSPAEGNDF